MKHACYSELAVHGLRLDAAVAAGSVSTKLLNELEATTGHTLPRFYDFQPFYFVDFEPGFKAPKI